MKKKAIKTEANLSKKDISQLKQNYLSKKGNKPTNFDVEKYEELKKDYIQKKQHQQEKQNIQEYEDMKSQYIARKNIKPEQLTDANIAELKKAYMDKKKKQNKNSDIVLDVEQYESLKSELVESKKEENAQLLE